MNLKLVPAFLLWIVSLRHHEPFLMSYLIGGHFFLFVSRRAAERFVLFIRAANPANPFEEELELDLLAILANTACLTRTAELSSTNTGPLFWVALIHVGIALIRGKRGRRTGLSFSL